MSDSRESIEEAEDADADEEQQPDNKNKKKKKEGKKNSIEFGKKLRGAKNLIMLPLRKFGNAYERRRMRPPSPPFPYSDDIDGKGFKLCFMQPRVLDSPSRQNPVIKTSSYHGFLRSLLERNDFYAPDCNVHRDS